MPFDSNGTFNRVIPGGWKADATAGIKIRADRHDDEDDGFATGLSTCITKDGRTQPTANIPMNGKKLVNLGEPDNPGDAATKNYVDTIKTFTTGIVINGAGPINGFINFTSPTGVNGIGWATADMSWIGKLEEADKHSKRLAVNDKADGTGTDVATIDEAGRYNNASGSFTHNLSYSGGLRTIVKGAGTQLFFGNRRLTVSANDTDTTVDFQLATMREFFEVQNSTGHAILTLTKEKSEKATYILSKTADENRWLIYLGDASVEGTGTTRTGSNFSIYSYDNNGAVSFQEMSINRSTHLTHFGGAISTAGSITMSGGNYLNFASYLQSISATAILASQPGGTVYLRPYGAANAASEVNLNADRLYLADGLGLYAGSGVRGRAGSGGGYSAYHNNFYWNGTYHVAYIDGTVLGSIAWQSDYRMKKNIKKLGSMWDKVKNLKPISYQQKKWSIFEENNTVRWGFVAHELQESLLESAALGKKDEENVIQSPDPMALIAALTKALQEAMGRIEVLEAGAHAH